MFSGKTDELIRRVRDAEDAAVLKPAVDTRHPPDLLVSHGGESTAAVTVASLDDLVEAAAGHASLFVDEVQFFDTELAEVVERLRTIGVEVVAAGLDLDFRREPFATTRALADAAQRVELFRAHCGLCGRDATVTQRLLNGRPAPLDDEVVRIGDDELYEPRCEDCWVAERERAPSGPVPTVERR
jgi:thymidine kinase